MKPYYEEDGIAIYHGDCVERLQQMEEASVDAVVCDPPYGIGFMGKEWDGVAIAEAAAKDRATRKSLGPESASRPGRSQPRSSSAFGNEAIIAGPVRGGIDFQLWCESWAQECLRILKPGGHLLAFGGTRTYHRLACAVEDAGFEIRDSLLWLYGSGFPKSLDVSKSIDNSLGAKRDVIGASKNWGASKAEDGKVAYGDYEGAWDITAPATSEAAKWDGWGTALKPAHEPIVVARKPLIGTVAQNVLEHGTGAINVDGCRVGTDTQRGDRYNGKSPMPNGYSGAVTGAESPRGDSWNAPPGRWPANVVLSHTPLCEPVGTCIVKGDPRETGGGERPGGFADVGAESGDGEPNAPVYGDEEVVEWDCAPGCPVAALDAQTGNLQSGFMAAGTQREGIGYRGRLGTQVANDTYGDAGGASRFFYCAKTSRAERNAGLEGFEEKKPHDDAGHVHADERAWDIPGSHSTARANHHPTVKPINLMRWLVRLVTPPGGTILDPFLGSGSTGCAAVLEGFDFLGIEREVEYVSIAKARIQWWTEHRGREAEEVLAAHGRSERESKGHSEAGQLGLALGAAR